MQIYLDISGNQIDGARDYQEDAFMISQLGDGQSGPQDALVVMADGMGGHAAGNVASNMATSTFNKTFSGKYPTENIPEVLRESLQNANDSIGAAVSETPGLQGMGCTMVSVFVSGDKLWWVSVGDSHLYLLRDRLLTKHNADHSYGGYLRLMREQGMEIEPDPNLSPNMLMSAMIGDEIAEIDLPSEPVTLQVGDRIIVASDGLDTLGQGAIIQYCAWSESARDTVEALLKAVTDADQPRQDNTTIVIIDVREGQEKVAAAPAPAPVESSPELETVTMEAVDMASIPEEIVVEDGLPLEDEQALEANYPIPDDEPSGGGQGLLIGIVLVVLLLGGGAGWYFLGGGDSSPSKQQPVIDPMLSESPEVSVVTTPEPVPVVEPVVAVPDKDTPSETSGQRIVDALKSGGEAPTMLVIPSGQFDMGGRGSSLKQNEGPRHSVSIKSIAVSEKEITFVQYDQFASATGRSKPPSDGMSRKNTPVVMVTWDDAYAYTQWLSRQTGHHYRLPSEAEWEYFSRAGTTTDFWWGRRVGEDNAHCFNCESGLHPRKPAKVGFFKPNQFGLYDTAGNVLEWVHDCYHPNYRDAPVNGTVWEGGDCTLRVVRGGAFTSPSSALRSGKRDKLLSTHGYDNVGIRLVRDLD